MGNCCQSTQPLDETPKDGQQKELESLHTSAEMRESDNVATNINASEQDKDEFQMSEREPINTGNSHNDLNISEHDEIKRNEDEVDIEIKLSCKGQKYVEKDDIVVIATYRQHYLIKNIFAAMETSLNAKYYPIIFTRDKVITGAHSFLVSEDLDDPGEEEYAHQYEDNPITKYDIECIKQKGLHISLEWKYLIEIDDLPIDCPQMVKSNTKDALQCDIYRQMLQENELNKVNLRHVENCIHFMDPKSDRPRCKYGDECKIFIRVERNGQSTVEDECHLMLYRHPPRTRSIKLSKNLHSFVMKSHSKQCHDRYEPTFEDKHYRDFTKELLTEVIRNGFRYDLCMKCSKDDDCNHGNVCSECSDENGTFLRCNHSKFDIFDIVEKKMNTKRYKLLDLDFTLGHMLALILYTGCDCNYDICSSQRNGDYAKWKWFDYLLCDAIQDISDKEITKFPVFSGLASVQIEKQTEPVGYFVTYVSTSSQEWIANEFSKGKGMLVRFDPEITNSNWLHCCDVSWISKFPDESEFLFARSLPGPLNNFRLEAIDNVDGKQIVALTEFDPFEMAQIQAGSDTIDFSTGIDALLNA